MSATDRLDQIEACDATWHDVADLVAALRAVLELHCETAAWAPPDETQATECAQGCTDSEGYSDYPCPTVRAIEEALS